MVVAAKVTVARAEVVKVAVVVVEMAVVAEGIVIAGISYPALRRGYRFSDSPRPRTSTELRKTQQ